LHGFLNKKVIYSNKGKVSKMVLNLIFMGPQGAGKGTVAQAVGEKHGLIQISTGDLCRAVVASGSELGKEVGEIINAGILVNDELIGKMFESKLRELSEAENFKGVILDGYPRTIEQGKQLDIILERVNQKLNAVIYIETSKENSLERLSGRWTCKACKGIYNAKTAPPKIAGKCDLDGAELYQRDDDTPEAITQRLEIYHNETAPLIEYYKEKGLLKSYDGNCPPAESINRGMKLVEELI